MITAKFIKRYLINLAIIVIPAIVFCTIVWLISLMSMHAAGYFVLILACIVILVMIYLITGCEEN